MAGNFVNGKEHGYFNIININDGNQIFTGNFNNGIKHGQGTEINGKTTRNGEWVNGKKNGVFLE